MKAIYTTNLIELQAWCRDYRRQTPYPSKVMGRFLIALYQLPGYWEWENTTNKHESAAAMAVNLLIMAEELELGIEGHVGPDLLLIETQGINYPMLLGNVCGASRQLTYGNPTNKTQRAKSRYDKTTLTNHVAELVRSSIGLIPSVSRGQAIQDATLIMTGKL